MAEPPHPTPKGGSKKLYAAVVGLILAGAALGVDVIKDKQLSISLAAALFIFFATALLVLLDISETTTREFSRVRKYIETMGRAITSSVRSSKDFYIEGDALSALDQITGSLGRALVVKNLYAPFPKPGDAPYKLTSDIRLSAFRSFFNNEQSYSFSEIIPADVAFSAEGRAYHKKMQELCQGGAHHSATSKQYNLLILDRPFPIVNFIIFYYGGLEREVFFGWGGFGGSAPAKVYSTTDAGAVQMFEAYYETLAQMCGRLDDSHSLAARLDRCLGFWLDVAFQVTTDGAAISRTPSNCGVLSFELDPDGRLFVRGITFKIRDDRVVSDMHSVFRSTSCELRRNKIFVSHDTIQSPDALEGQSAGKTTYDFKHFALLKYFRGTIISFRRNRAEGRFLETIGRKLPEQTAAAVADQWGNPAGIHAVIKEEAQLLLQEAVTQLSGATDPE
jgi:hypothetical protein